MMPMIPRVTLLAATTKMMLLPVILLPLFPRLLQKVRAYSLIPYAPLLCLLKTLNSLPVLALTVVILLIEKDVGESATRMCVTAIKGELVEMILIQTSLGMYVSVVSLLPRKAPLLLEQEVATLRSSKTWVYLNSCYLDLCLFSLSTRRVRQSISLYCFSP